MRHILYKTLIVIVVGISNYCIAQPSSLKQAVDKYSVTSTKISPWLNSTVHPNNGRTSTEVSGITQLLRQYSSGEWKNRLLQKSAMADSVLIIGDIPGEKLVVTGNWECKTDILVFNDGQLVFDHAQATIWGDIYVWGATALVSADASTIALPQEYFYQRSLLAVGGGTFDLKHTTLDFSGLSHNIVAADSAKIILTDIHKIGFTTNGLSGAATYIIDGTNLAGEFVIGDQCKLNFKNANTVLLWHQIPENATMHFSFPPSGEVASYLFNGGVAGISGIDYSIQLTDCTDVMWALMPHNNSDVEISNSQLRAIGLWFLKEGTVHVQGLVNNSDYTDFTASLSDRNLRLRNTSVRTWSLYPMRKSSLDIASCILGEIGSMGTSTVQSSSVFVDGSGGYMWASDTSFFIAFSTPATSTVRSERNGIMFYAYSPLSWGTATALGNSILFCIQSVLPEKPVPHDNACIWNLFLDQPSTGKTNSNIAILGNALIDNTLTSIYPNIAWYRLYYTIPGESTQYPIAKIENKNIYNDTLALWNTSGMEAGAYELHLEIANNASDTIKVEAVKSVILSRGFLGINEEEPDQITVYPNPATQDITIVNNNKPTTLQLINSEGKVLRIIEISPGRVTIDVSSLPAGLYQFFDLNSHTGNRGKFLKL